STSVKTPEALQRSSHPDTPHSPAPLLKSVVASGRVQMEVISGTGRVSVVNPLLCGRGESGAGIKERRFESFKKTRNNSESTWRWAGITRD
ncbi:hypothetical protein HHX47_DHR6000780, partial [Lentinula edodes]